MVPQPMLTCSSVSDSSQWYQRTLGLTSGHGGDEYEMLMYDGTLVLQLHELAAHEHSHLVRAGEPLGNGVAVWFESSEYAAAVAHARASGSEIVEDDHENPLAHHREIWLRDPDGYVVVISSPFGQTD
jgi:catechol 2,3-dioxygenase-like lactoylglutathione lyase family enzyme